MVAVDFTASNGYPSNPQSLHYFTESTPNSYQKALRSVANVLAPYDSDNHIPCFGFGAKVGGVMKHCFPLTFDESRAEVVGVDGLLGVYSHALPNIEFAGPTLFAPLLQRVNAMVERESSTSDRPYYAILLILTDGVINDMRNTIDAIVASSKLPLSIIICGIGFADFTAMDRLDADEVPLVSSQGEQMAVSSVLGLETYCTINLALCF